MDYGIFNVRTDVNACDCTQGFTDTVRESALIFDLGEKSLAAPGNRTCVGNVPVRCSTNWSTSPPLGTAQLFRLNISFFCTAHLDSAVMEIFWRLKVTWTFHFSVWSKKERRGDGDNKGIKRRRRWRKKGGKRTRRKEGKQSLVWRTASARQFLSSGQDQSTVAQQAKLTVDERYLASLCVDSIHS